MLTCILFLSVFAHYKVLWSHWLFIFTLPSTFFCFQRKPVKCIKAASALNRLLILCDSCLLILSIHDLEIIGGGPKLRGISTFCVNENPNVNNPFCIQVWTKIVCSSWWLLFVLCTVFMNWMHVGFTMPVHRFAWFNSKTAGWILMKCFMDNW